MIDKKTIVLVHLEHMHQHFKNRGKIFKNADCIAFRHWLYNQKDIMSYTTLQLYNMYLNNK